MILDMEAIHENIATIMPTAISVAIICTIRYASQNLKDAEKEMSVSFNSCPSFSPIANPNVLTVISHLKFNRGT
jgi:hypothetical protein